MICKLKLQVKFTQNINPITFYNEISSGEIEMGDYEILQKYSKDSDIAKLDQSFFERLVIISNNLL